MEQVIYGRPALEAVTMLADSFDARRLLIVTTKSLDRAGGALASLRDGLGARCAGTFSSIRAHSPRVDVVACAEAAREAKADLLVALGGGSVIDATKVMFLAIWRGARSIDELSKLAGVRGGANPEASAWGWDTQSLRMIAIPTTLSAAEFYTSAGVTDVQRHVKQMYSHPMAVPVSVILDPAATLETPIDLLLSTGMRAVDHAVEGWCSVRSAPIADACNRESMWLLADSLARIRRDASDLEARAAAQQGMWLSRIGTMAGITNGASHGIGYLLGGGRGVPHGVTSCITLPAVLAWNASVNAARQSLVSEAFGGAGKPAGEVMRRFVISLGQPTRLRDVGIAREELPAIAASWDGTGPIATNPRPVKSKDDLLEILELAY
jgi:maleylacetate reductase